MKKYVILSGTVDGETCEDEGFLDCASFGLAKPIAYGTLEEAIAARDRLVETDLADAYEDWDANEEGRGISFKTFNASEAPESDKYLDVYYRRKVINETTYKIAEVEF